MMKIHSIKITLLIVLSVILHSCYEDKGNYKYVELNEISFELKENYSINVGERLTIRPEMKQTIPVNEEDFDYLWIKMGTTTSGVAFDTIYREKNMVDFLPPLAAGSNRMIYKAKDRNTGQEYISDYFKITIHNDIRTGFLLLCESEEGQTELNFLNYVDNYFDRREIDLSAIPDRGAPIAVNTYVDMYSPYIGFSPAAEGYAVNMLTETGLYRLLHSDLSYQDIYNARYAVFGDWDSGFRITDIIPARSKNIQTSMLRNQDGNFIYYYVESSATHFWTIGNYCNSYQNTTTGVLETFPTSDVYGFNAGVAVFFDTAKKAWVYKANQRHYCSNYPDDNAGDDFKLKNVTYEPLALFPVYYTTGSSSTYAAVIKEQDGNIAVIYWHHTNGQKRGRYSLSNMINIQNAKLFAMPYSTTNAYASSHGAFIYYATDTEIYLCHMNGTNNRLVYQAAPGQTISQMDIMVPANQSRNTVDNPFAYHLAVVTNGTSPNSGTFEVFEITPTYGDLTLATTAPKKENENDPEPQRQELKWTGLPKIVDFDWKNK